MADESRQASAGVPVVEGGGRLRVAGAQGDAMRAAVYFIRGADMVKIGKTTADSLRQRLSMLQTGSPVKLTVIRLIDGGMQAEAWLHRRFAGLRAHGEWFKYSDEMLSVHVPAELVAADNGRLSARDAEWRRAEALWWNGVLNNEAGISGAEYLEREYQKWVQSAEGQNFLRRMPRKHPVGRPRRSDAAQAPAVVGRTKARRAGR